MPGTSRVAIVSNALVRLGKAPIQTETDSNARGIAAFTIYDEIAATALSAFPWSFALKSYTPGVKSNPTTDFTSMYEYVFQVPPEAARVLGLQSRDEYIIAEAGELWTGDSAAEIWYIKNVGPASYQPWFTSALVGELASALCLAVTGDNSRFTAMAAQAEKKWIQARLIDSQQRTPETLRYMDLIRAEPESIF